MYRTKIDVEPTDPYEYVIYNSHHKDGSYLEHALTFHRICTLLRRYPNIEQYSVDYWNELFDYFCILGTFKDGFCNIEQIIDSLTLEACVERLGGKRIMNSLRIR